MIDQELLSTLWCPTCQNGALTFGRSGQEPGPGTGSLTCERCGRDYPVKAGVPALFPHNAMSTREWGIWREHLQKFQARREDRIRRPNRIVTRAMKVSRPNRSFVEFTEIRAGSVLDVGCGRGGFRSLFTGQGVAYFGLDPIALPETTNFRFVRGLAEYLPFRNGSFTDLIVAAAMDHFRDTERFLGEAERVLRSGGRLHILQSVHEIRGPVSALKVLAHKSKDAIEDRNTRQHGSEIPKHLSEFTKASLVQTILDRFDLVSAFEYNSTWYAPTKLFLSVARKEQ